MNTVVGRDDKRDPKSAVEIKKQIGKAAGWAAAVRGKWDSLLAG